MTQNESDFARDRNTASVGAGRDDGSSILVKENNDHVAAHFLAFDLSQAGRSNTSRNFGCTLL
jgi:hypothetical protein